MYLLLLLVAVSLVHSKPGPIRSFVSNAAGDRLKAMPLIHWSDVPPSLPEITIELTPETRYQVYDGVGGSFLRSGAIVLNKLPEHVQREVLEALFHPTRGARFTLGKLPIAATDFMPPVWYSYDDHPYDVSLSHFSIAHDEEKESGTIDYVKRAAAVAGRMIRLESTMDYPPEWMLNYTTLFPQTDLNVTMLEPLSRYYLKWVEALRKHNIPLEFMSMFNERGYCRPSLQNLRDTLVKYLAPLFKKTPGTPKITWVECSGRLDTIKDTPPFFALPGAKESVEVMMYHGYDCGDAYGGWVCNGLNTTCPHIENTMQRMRAWIKTNVPAHMRVWMTELCYADEFGDYPGPPKCPKLPRYDFQDSMQWGYMIFGDFGVVGASGWIYWNMILDTTGGPWLTSPEHNDPNPNIQQPVIVADPTTGKFYKTGVYYALAHFGRFVEPGSTRIALDPAKGSVIPSNMKVIAFEHPTKVTIVLMNDLAESRDVYLVYKGFGATITMSPISFTTLEFKLA